MTSTWLLPDQLGPERQSLWLALTLPTQPPENALWGVCGPQTGTILPEKLVLLCLILKLDSSWGLEPWSRMLVHLKVWADILTGLPE